MKIRRIITASILSSFAIGLLAGSIVSKNANDGAYVPTFASYPTGDAATYYSNISNSLTGNDLLNALRSLNNSKKQTSGGYKALLTGAFHARYTDYDINHIEYDANGRPYSNYIVSFYSGNVAYNASGMNREHVWPDSRGGNLVEADTHMARPTLNAENSARGNSFYVEGMKSTTSGWDPAMESFGDESYRGDSARIIFYCAMANGSLSLIDATNDSANNKTMGKLSDLIKWNINYPVKQREQNRNEGVEYIQGNRNPFIDHPEYACRIWGNASSEIATMCQNAHYDTPEYHVISVREVVDGEAASSAETSYSLLKDDSINLVGYVDGAYDSSIQFTLLNNDLTTYTGNEVTMTSYTDSNYSGVTLTGDNAGSCYLKATYTFIDSGGETQTDFTNIKIAVRDPSGGGGGDVTEATLVTANSMLSNGDLVVVKTEEGVGVTGYNGSKDATVSSTESEWKQFIVGNANSSGFTLYDSAANKYIASPGGNEFKYDTNAGTCSVDEEGHLKCNSRYLCVNGNVYRFYTTIGSYTPFFVYKVPKAVSNELTGLTLDIDDVQTEFLIGDTFNSDNLVVTATYGNGDTKVLTDEEYSITAPNLTMSGQKEVIISYEEDGFTVTESYFISVRGVLSSIELVNPKTTYNVGDDFEKPDIIARYSDGGSEDVTDFVQESGTYNMNVAGEYTITYSYTQDEVVKTAEYHFTVEEPAIIPTLTTITVDYTNAQTTFTVGDTFSSEGLVVTAHYSDGTSEDVTNYTVSQPDMSTAGSKTITVTYENIDATYTIQVNEPEPVHVENVSLNAETKTLKIGETFQLEVTITPSDAENQNYYFDSTNPRVANVSANGLVYAYSKGEATIIVTTVDGEHTASCVITVREDKSQSNKLGCGGNIIATSVILSSLSIMGIGLLLIKRKTDK